MIETQMMRGDNEAGIMQERTTSIYLELVV